MAGRRWWRHDWRRMGVRTEVLVDFRRVGLLIIGKKWSGGSQGALSSDLAVFLHRVVCRLVHLLENRRMGSTLWWGRWKKRDDSPIFGQFSPFSDRLFDFSLNFSCCFSLLFSHISLFLLSIFSYWFSIFVCAQFLMSVCILVNKMMETMLLILWNSILCCNNLCVYNVYLQIHFNFYGQFQTFNKNNIQPSIIFDNLITLPIIKLNLHNQLIIPTE